jgi:PilZ domain-containing protein
MRKFIRHPSDIPIDFELENLAVDKKNLLNDISEGGLSFQSKRFVEPGSVMMVRIPLRNPIFEEEATVAWCKNNGDSFDVGVRFIGDATDFRLRMIEQVCHIEHYKKEIMANEGRALSGTEAASEWVSKFAKDFPR